MGRHPAFMSWFWDETIKKAEATQGLMHDFIEKTMASNPKISYQDAANTFMILKISEHEVSERNRIIAEDQQKWHDGQFKH